MSNFGERYPSGSWLPESVKSLLGEKTELKYIVYTHGHWVSQSCVHSLLVEWSGRRFPCLRASVFFIASVTAYERLDENGRCCAFKIVLQIWHGQCYVRTYNG